MELPAKNETIQLRAIRSGDVREFKDLFEQKYPGLVKLAFHYVGEEALAKDMVQQVFIRLWEKKESLFIRDSISAYLRQMVINECLAHLRKQKRRNELARPSLREEQLMVNDTDGRLIENEMKDKIRHAVGALPERCREIFEMSRYQNMTYREIAGELGISIKTVENQMGTALKKLRHALLKHLHMLYWCLFCIVF